MPSSCLIHIVGPPIIVATHTMFIPNVICTAKFISVPSTYFVKWYLLDEFLNISSNHNQTCTEETITVYMHGVPVAVAGHKATLTIQIDTEIGKNKNISLVLMNELGKSSFSFYNLWIGNYNLILKVFFTIELRRIEIYLLTYFSLK